MKFSTSSSELLKKVQLVGGAIGSNPVLPILEDFLFTISGNKLAIAATDLETSITTEIDIQADADGSVAIPGKILLETLKALPEQPITFEVNDENFGIEITSAYGKYKLAGENGADFPRIPEEENADIINLPCATLSSAISRTLFAASNDELRPAMTGVLFEIEEGKLTMVATDAHKLVKYDYTDVKSDVPSSFIVPRKSLNLLKGALPGGDELKVSYNKANAFFSFGDVNLVCRLIDARYPDYNAVIPTNNPHILTISRTDFLSSLKRIVIYANKTTNQVVLNVKNSSLNISAQDLDFSNEASEEIPCTFDGEDMTIGFNAKFLIEMLGVLDTDEVKLQLSTSTRAGILTPTENDDHEEILMLVMPVMLTN